MRLRHADGSLLHLAYCSNVHPADDLDGVSAQLERYTARVRERLDVPVLGIGLWVAAPALADRGRGRPARRAAGPAQPRGRDAQRLPVQGVPRAGGQARRLLAALGAGRAARDYTLGLARLLARLLPDDVEEGSDLDAAARLARGLGRASAGRRAARRWPTSPVELEAARSAETGKRIRLALEPEPGCTIETIAQACDALARARARLDRRLPGRLPPRGAVRGAGRARSQRCGDAGVPIVKTQVSSALRVPDPGSEEGRELLARFDEPRFLHQVRECVNSHVEGTDDLPEALEGGLPGAARVARALPRAGQHGRAHDAGRAERDARPRWPAARRR